MDAARAAGADLRRAPLRRHRRGHGAPRDVLTKRLRTLEQAGLIVRRLYNERPPRSEYHLTGLGREASEVLLLLMAFGDRHLSEQAPVVWSHGEAGTPEHDLDPVLLCRACGRPAAEGMHAPTGPGAPEP